MQYDGICPHCGKGLAFAEASADATADPLLAAEAPHAHTVETIIPHTLCGDDDHAPGVFLATPDGGYAGAEDAATTLDVGQLRGPAPLSGGSAEFDPLASPVADPTLDAFLGDADPLGPAAPARGGPRSRVIPPPSLDRIAPRPSPSEARTIADDGDEAGRPPWSLVLLGSYASAATLALAWLLWTGRGRPADPAAVPEPPPAATRPATPAPLAEDRRTALGRTLAVGSLEVTPLSIAAGRVPLKGGGDGALILRLRLKNVSADERFAPLERGFVRLTDAGPPETFIEAADGPIEMYPLAEASERSLAGQDFGTLAPGEARATILVSDRDARRRLSGAMTWRLRLRVDPVHLATVGVTFAPGDVR